MPIFRLRTGERGHSRSGLTLIEILLVLVLITIILRYGVPGVNKIFRANLKTSARRYSSIIRQAYAQAVLTRRLHRVVIDLDADRWSLESAEPGALPVDELQSSLVKDLKNLGEADEVVSPFKEVKSAKKNQLPGGVDIIEVDSWRLGKKQPITSGQISIYAYPSGLIDKATVVFGDKGKKQGQRYIVNTEGLTGRVTIEVENAQN